MWGWRRLPISRPKRIPESSDKESRPLSKPIKVQIVERARALIADEQHWCRGNIAQDVSGVVVSPRAGDPSLELAAGNEASSNQLVLRCGATGAVPLKWKDTTMGNDPRSGQDNPGQGTPGQGNPGQGNPGQGNPGQGNPDQGNPGQRDPGEENPGQAKPSQDNPGQGSPNN